MAILPLAANKPMQSGLFTIVAFYFGLLLFDTIPCHASESNKYDNQLIICLHDPIHNLDPAIHRSRHIQIILKNIFDSLTIRDVEMSLVPQLAESWKALNETSWEFKLRKGVKFHNDEEFTAEDAKFSLERIFKEGGLGSATSPRKSLLGPVSEVKIMDQHTIVIKTEKPWPILPLMLSLQEMVPKDYMQKVGSEGFKSHPIGTGPFKFVNLKGDERIILERFDNYYGGSPDIPPVGPAPLNSLIFEFVPTKSKQIQMLKKNECSIISRIEPSSLPILKADPNIEILSIVVTRSHFAEFNCSKPPFDDPRVRQALNYAVDINKVVDVVLQNNGIVLPTVMLPSSNYYNDLLDAYPYDPENAKRLLKDANFNAAYEIQIRCNKDELPFANIIASFLSQIGLKSKISLAKYRKPSILGEDARWDIDLGSWGNSTLDPVGIIFPKFSSGGRGNYSGYSNPEIDSLLKRAEGTSDLNLRKAIYNRIQEIIYADAPMIFGYAKIGFYGVRKEVQNFFPSSTGMMNMHDVYIEKGSNQ